VREFSKIKEGYLMRFFAPKRITWWVSVILAGLGIISELGLRIPLISSYSFVLIAISAILMIIATRIRAL
jgi:hypothetical protein